MKTCPSCGAACNDNEKFCGNCGYSFQEDSSVFFQSYAPAETAYPLSVAPVYPGCNRPVSSAPKVATKNEFLKFPLNRDIRNEFILSSIITFVCAGNFLLVGLSGGEYSSLIDVAILVCLGLGLILSYSRVCAILLLVYGLLSVGLRFFQGYILIPTVDYLIVIAGVLAVIYAFKAEKLWKQYQQNP